MKLHKTLPLICLFLAACQQQTKHESATPTQIQQLSALVASASWLRDNCARTDIPGQQKLIDAALEQAKLKGWRMDSISKNDIQNASLQRYQALTNDTQKKEEKCAVLNSSAAPFLQKIK